MLEVDVFELHAVDPSFDEKYGVVGLPCAFCSRYYREIGTKIDEIQQVQVSRDGLELKRWGGGTFVWKCGRCRILQRTVTLEGLIEIDPIIPEATVEDVRRMVGRSVYDLAQRTKW